MDKSNALLFLVLTAVRHFTTTRTTRTVRETIISVTRFLQRPSCILQYYCQQNLIVVCFFPRYVGHYRCPSCSSRCGVYSCKYYFLSLSLLLVWSLYRLHCGYIRRWRVAGGMWRYLLPTSPRTPLLRLYYLTLTTLVRDLQLCCNAHRHRR